MNDDITVERIMYWGLATGMVEALTEFDFAPGHSHSIPDDLRDRLIQWCADLDAWGDREHPREVP